MNSKRKGSRVELKCQKLLESCGYFVCKSGGSLGLFDLIAINANGMRLIQCKANRNAPPAEREAIGLFAAPANCTREIWIWKDYDRAPIITVF